MDQSVHRTLNPLEHCLAPIFAPFFLFYELGGGDRWETLWRMAASRQQTLFAANFSKKTSERKFIINNPSGEWHWAQITRGSELLVLVPSPHPSPISQLLHLTQSFFSLCCLCGLKLRAAWEHNDSLDNFINDPIWPHHIQHTALVTPGWGGHLSRSPDNGGGDTRNALL